MPLRPPPRPVTDHTRTASTTEPHHTPGHPPPRNTMRAPAAHHTRGSAPARGHATASSRGHTHPVDKKSGSTTDRPGLRALLGYARDGDVIVVHTLDRLGRTVRDTLNLIHDLSARGVGVRNLAAPVRIDSSNPKRPDGAAGPGPVGVVRADGTHLHPRTGRARPSGGHCERPADWASVGGGPRTSSPTPRTYPRPGTPSPRSSPRPVSSAPASTATSRSAPPTRPPPQAPHRRGRDPAGDHAAAARLARRPGTGRRRRPRKPAGGQPRTRRGAVLTSSASNQP